MRDRDVEYGRLHRRCMNQRRELRRLNRKLSNEVMILAMRTLGFTQLQSAYGAIDAAREIIDLRRKLRAALDRLAIAKKREAAE